jgi:hypothetical protein
MGQVVTHLPTKCKVLRSNSGTEKNQFDLTNSILSPFTLVETSRDHGMAVSCVKSVLFWRGLHPLRVARAATVEVMTETW